LLEYEYIHEYSLECLRIQTFKTRMSALTNIQLWIPHIHNPHHPWIHSRMCRGRVYWYTVRLCTVRSTQLSTHLDRCAPSLYPRFRRSRITATQTTILCANTLYCSTSCRQYIRCVSIQDSVECWDANANTDRRQCHEQHTQWQLIPNLQLTFRLPEADLAKKMAEKKAGVL
jgi:hypothetical protein